MSEPSALTVVGITPFKTNLWGKDIPKIIQSLEYMKDEIVKLESLITKMDLSHPDEFQMSDIADHVKDIAWYLNDIDDGCIALDDIEQVQHYLTTLEDEIEGRLSPDEEEELGQLRTVHKLKNK